MKIAALLIALAAVCAAPDFRSRNMQQNNEVPFDPSVDYCKIGEDAAGENVYGDCDPAVHFPACGVVEQVCYHRINRRDLFYPDKQPHYYIDPRRVLCVPVTVQCHVCTPGRYCLSNGRCILDFERYEGCEEWL